MAGVNQPVFLASSNIQSDASLQLVRHAVGVTLASGDVGDELLPFVFADLGFEGVDGGLQDEGLHFAAYLALRPRCQRAAFTEVGAMALDGIHQFGDALA